MTTYQKSILMKEFKASPFLTKEQQHHLATLLNISVKKIGAWYAKSRFDKKKEGLPIEGEYSCNFFKYSKWEYLYY